MNFNLLPRCSEYKTQLSYDTFQFGLQYDLVRNTHKSDILQKLRSGTMTSNTILKPVPY